MPSGFLWCWAQWRCRNAPDTSPPYSRSTASKTAGHPSVVGSPRSRSATTIPPRAMRPSQRCARTAQLSSPTSALLGASGDGDQVRHDRLTVGSGRETSAGRATEEAASGWLTRPFSMRPVAARSARLWPIRIFSSAATRLPRSPAPSSPGVAGLITVRCRNPLLVRGERSNETQGGRRARPARCRARRGTTAPSDRSGPGLVAETMTISWVAGQRDGPATGAPIPGARPTSIAQSSNPSGGAWRRASRGFPPAYAWKRDAGKRSAPR